MHERDDDRAGRDGPASLAEDAGVARRIRDAGPRPPVPAADLAAIQGAFRAAWEQHVRRRRARRLAGLGAALAASLLAAFGIARWDFGRSRWTPASPGPPAATVVHLAGRVLLWPPGGLGGPRGIAPAVGAPVPGGAELEVAPAAGGGVALRLADGAALRVDSGSRLRLLSAEQVWLERGAVYIDSDARTRKGHGLAVRTPLGIVREVGTQFEVRLLPASGALRVRVREGEVRVGSGQAEQAAGRGIELTLGSDGAVGRAAVPRCGADWAWVWGAAPRFEIEGRSVAEFLDWVSRETGWQVRYSDAQLAAAAGSIRLHGTLGDLPADQAAAAVLPSAELLAQVADCELLIGARPHRAAGPSR